MSRWQSQQEVQLVVEGGQVIVLTFSVIQLYKSCWWLVLTWRTCGNLWWLTISFCELCEFYEFHEFCEICDLLWFGAFYVVQSEQSWREIPFLFSLYYYNCFIYKKMVRRRSKLDISQNVFLPKYPGIQLFSLPKSIPNPSQFWDCLIVCSKSS